MTRPQKPGIPRTQCEYCGNEFAEQSLSRHIGKCPVYIQQQVQREGLASGVARIPSEIQFSEEETLMASYHNTVAKETGLGVANKTPERDDSEMEGPRKSTRINQQERTKAAAEIDSAALQKATEDEDILLASSGAVFENEDDDMMDVTDMKSVSETSLDVYFPISRNVVPYLSGGDDAVLGETFGNIRIHAHDDNMSDTAAARTDTGVPVNVHGPVTLTDPWNDSVPPVPFPFPVDDPAYDPTTSGEHRSMMRLYGCTEDARCPRYFLDKFLSILREEINSHHFDLNRSQSRAAFVKYFTEKYPTAPPVIRDVPLETDVSDISNVTIEEFRRRHGDVAKVVTFDFKSQLHDLLGDKQIWGDPDNLQVNKNQADWFNPYHNDSGTLDDLCDGSWYTQTINVKAIGKDGREFLIPIILYMDKTGTDVYQRYSLEPILFTLGVFSRQIRNQTRAWRPLGFVPDLQLSSTSMKHAARSSQWGKGISERNYHTCLRVALESFIECQQRSKTATGLKAWLRIGHLVKAVNLVVPLCIVIGDAKSGDMLCGRYGAYNTSRLSRACSVSLKECANPKHQCILVNSRMFENWCSLAPAPVKFRKKGVMSFASGDTEYLKKLHAASQHRHISAFVDVDFGANTRGISGATPTDLMHAFLEGVLKYLLRIIVAPLSHDEKASLDSLITHVFRNHRGGEMQASTFLKKNFSHGFTNLTQLTADEWAGMTFALLVVLRLKSGQDILRFHFHRSSKEGMIPPRPPDTDLPPVLHDDYSRDGGFTGNAPDEDKSKIYPDDDDSSEDSDNYINKPARQDISNHPVQIWEVVELLERVLAFHAFYKRGAPYKWSTPNEDESRIRLMIRQMLHMIVVLFPRTEGMGWHIQKFHELLHMPSDMRQYGCPQNYDTGPPESSLIVFAKIPAKTAAKSGFEIFSETVALRLYESQCFARMMRTESSYDELANSYNKKHRLDLGDVDSDATISSEATPTTAPGKLWSELVGKPKFEFFLDDNGIVQSKWLGKQKHKRLVEIHPVVIKFILNRFFLGENCHHSKIEGFTEYVRNGVRFRAHPNYQSIGGWYDYVMVAFSAGEDETNRERLKDPPNNAFDPYAPTFGPRFYPAKILAFLRVPNIVDPSQPPDILAVVHSCDNRSPVDIAADTRLIQQWSLEYNNPVNVDPTKALLSVDGKKRTDEKIRSYREPTLRDVPVDAFDKRVLVIEENPGIHQHIEDSNDMGVSGSNTILLVKDRDKHWADQFLNWDSKRTRRYLGTNTKKRKGVSRHRS